MRYVSLFSGIEAVTVATEPLGWEPVAFAEIEPFPCAVLAHHWPHVPNLGDVTKIDWERFKEEHGTVDVVVGGSPCQSFSIAGGRESLAGESALCFEYWRAVRDLRPPWFLWENVPGVFSTRDNAFGQFLGKMEELGYGMAWRTLDAQFFGVAQRRRRVFLVGHLGGGGGVPQRYSLTPKACAGILSRAERRGKSLPEPLASVLRAVASSSTKEQEREVSATRGAIPDTDSRLANQAVLSFAQNTRDELRVQGDGDVSGALSAQPGMKQTTYVLQSDGSTSVNSHGDGYYTDGSAYTLNCIDRQSVVCVADDNANAATDVDMCGSLKVGGGSAVNSNGDDLCGTLAARDFKGVGNQYVEEGKVICQRKC